MAGFYAQLVVNNPITTENQTQNYAIAKRTSASSNDNKVVKAKTEPYKRKNYSKIVGTIGASILYANSKVGEYTGNHLQTSNTNALLGTAITVGVGILAGHPVMAGVGLGLMVAKGAIDVGIKQINSQQESTYRRSLVGSPTTSGSRWGGKYN